MIALVPDPSLDKILTSIDRQSRLKESVDNGMDRLWREFGAAVRHKREARKWSLAFLGKKLGIGHSMMAYLETGDRDWTAELAAQAARELGP